VLVHEGLREHGCGEAEGRLGNYFIDNMSTPIGGNPLDHRFFDGAESIRDVATRIYAATEEIFASTDPAAIVVTHGGAHTYVVAAWLALPIGALGQALFGTTAAAITQLSRDERFATRVLDVLASVEHLQGV
jgi:broad specificity phosphatase PhoE